MIISFFTLIFVIAVFIIAIRVKSILYVDEHVAAIQSELNTFDDNFKTLKKVSEVSDFKLGSGHLYE